MLDALTCARACSCAPPCACRAAVVGRYTPEMPGKGLGNQRTMRGHDCDILSAVFCPPALLCTGSSNGEILTWNLQTTKVKPDA